MTKDARGKGGNFDTRPNPWGAQGGAHIAPEFAEVSSLGSTFDTVCRAGCALMVGHTRDGGAVVLTVLDADQRHRTYCSNVAELEDAITALVALYSTA